MEYAEGGELFDYIIIKRKMEEKEAAKFLQQILSGVEYLHLLNIAHRYAINFRDLKPENCLLDSK